MNPPKTKTKRRILGFKEWLKLTAQKQKGLKDKGQKTPPETSKPMT